MMDEFTLLWIGKSSASLAIRYALIAVLWLVALLINTKRRSRFFGGILCLYGTTAITLAALPIWRYNRILGDGGRASFNISFPCLFGMAAVCVYTVIMVWTVVHTCLCKRSKRR